MIAGFFLSLFFACNPEKPVNPQPNPDLKTLKLKFEKLVSGRKILRQQEILNQLQNEKSEKVSNFALKSIELDSETKKFAELKGKNPNFEIHFRKSGTFRAKIILQRKGYKDVTIPNCEFEVRAEKLIFQKFTRVLSAGNLISKNQILAKISGAKENFTLKKIELSGLFSENEFAKIVGEKPNLQINLQKAGKFSAKITLEKTDYFDAEITGCEFEITNFARPILSFQKITQKFGTLENRISSEKILEKISGTKDGYTLKNIVIPPNKSAFARKNGTKPYLSLEILRAGIFTAKLILEKPNYPDVEIENCEFEIEKGDAKNLRFPKLSHNLKMGNSLDKTAILENIRGEKEDYILKNITIPQDQSDFANVSGTKPNFTLNLLKKGNFSANIILEHPSFADKTLNCEFEIVREDFTFEKLRKDFSEDLKITPTEIFQNIRDTDDTKKTGYSLKTITLQQNGFGNVRANFEIRILRAGKFTAKIILENAAGDKKTISGAKFEIEKGSARSFGFRPFVMQFDDHGNLISKNEFWGNITGNTGGYELQAVGMAGGGNDFAEIEGRKIRVKKVGDFVVTITLRHRDYNNSIFHARFRVNPGQKPSLNFNNFTRSFSESKTITTQQILNQIVGDKTNYFFRSISITSSTSDLAEIENPAPYLRIKIKKAGVFTATITLQKENYEDVILNNCEFNITKIPKPTNLNFPVFKTVFANNKIISETDILGNISGDISGYAIKNISGLRVLTGGDVAEIENKTLKIKKLGKFQVKIILEKENYEDVFLGNCEFEILGAAPILSFEKLEKRYGNIPISENEIFGKIRGLGGLDYKIKRIFNLQDLSGVGMAEVRGKTLKMNKIGKFKVDISLELAGYENAEITGCEFEITKRLLKITGLQNGDAKIYDGTPPTPKGTPVLSGVLAGDTVNISEIKYYTDGAGTDLPIKIQAKLGGADAGKYELSQELSGVTQTLEAVVTFDASKKEVTGLKNKFKALTGLKMIIPAKIDGVKVYSIKTNAFKNLTGIETVKIEEGVEEILDDVFSGSSLVSIIFPKFMKKIRPAFTSCSKLTKLDLPEGIRSIGAVFIGGTSIKRLVVPKSVEVINHSSFILSILEVLVFLRTNPPSNLPVQSPFITFSDFFAGKRLQKIIVPKGSLNAYRTNNALKKVAGIIEEAE